MNTKGIEKTGEEIKKENEEYRLKMIYLINNLNCIGD
jgi:hypothetical protein